MNYLPLKLIAGITGLAITSFPASFGAAQAQTNPTPAPANGLTGSYLGVTVDAGSAFGLGQEYLQQTSSPAQWFINQATAGSQPGAATANSSQAAELDGRALQGRIDLNHLPVSIRGKMSLGTETNVMQPIVSYDLAIARNTNLYAGAGYSFVSSKDKNAAPNNQEAFFVTAGAEAAVSDKVIIYGDAQYPLNQSELKIAAPVKVQFGLGFRF